MKIAIPTTDGCLCDQFPGCRHFTLMDLDEAQQLCRTTALLEAPDGDDDETVEWLVSQGVELVLAGRMDPMTERAFCAAGIQLVLDAPGYCIHAVVARYLLGQLEMARSGCLE